MKGCVARGIPRGSGSLRAALAEVVGMRFQRGGQGAAGLADPRTRDPAGGIPGLGATSLPEPLAGSPQQPSALIQRRRWWGGWSSQASNARARPSACPTAKPAAAGPPAFSTVLRPDASRDDLQAEGLGRTARRARRPASRRGSRAGPAPADRGDALSGVSAVTVPTAGVVRESTTVRIEESRIRARASSRWFALPIEPLAKS